MSGIASNLRTLLKRFFTSMDARSTIWEMSSMLDTLFAVAKETKDEDKPVTQLSEEKKTELVERVRHALMKIGEKAETREMRSDLLAIYDYWSAKKSEFKTDLEKEFKKLYDEGFNILNRFTGRDLQTLEDHVRALYQDINNDPEAKSFFEDFRKWCDNVVNHPETARAEATTQDGKKLMDRSIAIKNKYGKRFRELLDEIKLFAKSFQDDPYLNEYQRELKYMKRAFSGSFLDTMAQLRLLCLPLLQSMTAEIQMPRIEQRDPSGTWTVDSLVLRGREITLDDVNLSFKFGLKNLLKAVVEIKNIDVILRDVHFTYDRTSIPSFFDEGKFNCRIQTPKWKLKWIVREETGRAPCFELAEVQGGIRKVAINITQANHKFLDNLLMPMMQGTLRRRAQNAVENAMRTQGELVTQKFNQFFANPEGLTISMPSIFEAATTTTTTTKKVPSAMEPAGAAAPAVKIGGTSV
jgi:regulator of replication initiation timing